MPRRQRRRSGSMAHATDQGRPASSHATVCSTHLGGGAIMPGGGPPPPRGGERRSCGGDPRRSNMGGGGPRGSPAGGTGAAAEALTAAAGERASEESVCGAGRGTGWRCRLLQQSTSGPAPNRARVEMGGMAQQPRPPAVPQALPPLTGARPTTPPAAGPSGPSESGQRGRHPRLLHTMALWAQG